MSVSVKKRSKLVNGIAAAAVASVLTGLVIYADPAAVFSMGWGWSQVFVAGFWNAMFFLFKFIFEADTGW